MASFRKRLLVKLVLWNTLVASTFGQVTSSDAAMITAPPQLAYAIDTTTVASYSNALDSVKKRPKIKPDTTVNIVCSGCNIFCRMGCLRPWPSQPPELEYAMWSGKTTYNVTATQTPDLPYPPASIVTATEPPLRTVLAINDTKAETKRQANLAKQDSYDISVASAPKPGSEITDSYYAIELTGQHGGAIPVVLADGKGTPYQLYGYANTSLFSSFISASLLEDLARSGETVPIQSKSPYTPEHDIIRLLGYDTKILGEVTMDLLVGVNDRVLKDVKFTVLSAPTKKVGWWRADLIIGINFLNRVQGLVLTDEFTGGVGAGGKKGLGLWVQRVFETEGSRDEAVQQMESEEDAKGQGQEEWKRVDL